MFRKMNRIKQAISKEECIDILKKEPRGVLSVNGDNGYPYAIPINHYYNENDNKLYFHGGKHGHKIDSIRNNNKVSFCVYDSVYRNDGEWALNIKSVVVFGKAEFVSDERKMLEIVRKLSYKFTDDKGYIEEEIRNSAKNTLMFCVTIEHISGKLVNEA